MTPQTLNQAKEQVESGIKGYFFPILMSVLGFTVTLIAYNISASLNKIEEKIEQINEEVEIVKREGRDSVKDIQFINLRLQNIEADLRDIKKTQENSI